MTRVIVSILGSVGGLALVNAGNMVLNLALLRWLSPSLFTSFAQLMTLFMIATIGVTALQVTAMKLSQDGDIIALNRLRKLSLGMSATVMFFASLFAWLVLGPAHGLTLSAFALLLILPLSLELGMSRGVMQGRDDHQRFVCSFIIELATRVVVTLGLLVFDQAMLAAPTGLVASIWVSAAWSFRKTSKLAKNKLNRSTKVKPSTDVTVGLLLQAALLLSVEADLLLLSAHLAPQDLNSYAAVLLLARLVVFAFWPLTIILMPIVRKTRNSGLFLENRLILLGMLLACIGMTFTLLTTELLATMLYGSRSPELMPFIPVLVASTACFAWTHFAAMLRHSVGDKGPAIWMAGIAFAVLSLAATGGWFGLDLAAYLQLKLICGLILAAGCALLVFAPLQRRLTTTCQPA